MRAARGTALGSPVSLVAAILLGSMLLWTSREARAQPEPGRTVEVVIAASSPEDASRLQEAIADPLRRLHVATRIEHATSIEPRDVITPRASATVALARVWFDLTSRERATLYLVDGPWERVLVRHVPLPTGLDEVAREELSLILRAAVESLLAGARIGLSRDEAARDLAPAPPPTAAPARKRPAPESATPPAQPPVVFELGVSYEAELFSRPEPVVHGPGASLRLASGNGTLRGGGELTAQYRIPASVDATPIGVELQTVALRALGTLDWMVGRNLSLRGALGAGADVVRIQPQLAEDAHARLTPATLEALPVVRALIGVHPTLFGRAGLLAGLACDVDVLENRYVARRQTGEALVLSPWRVRPALVLGVSMASAGAR